MTQRRFKLRIVHTPSKFEVCAIKLGAKLARSPPGQVVDSMSRQPYGASQRMSVVRVLAKHGFFGSVSAVTLRANT